jgi:hypothetical protein
VKPHPTELFSNEVCNFIYGNIVKWENNL